MFSSSATFIRFNDVEIRRIEIDKWCLGCEIKQDPGQRFILDWIKENAKSFRESWEISCCKSCANWEVCGWQTKKVCNNYIGEIQ